MTTTYNDAKIRNLKNELATLDSDVFIDDAVFNGNINIHSCKPNTVIFENVHFKGSLLFENINNPHLKIEFRKCRFDSDVYFKRGLLNSLNFHSCEGGDLQVLTVKSQGGITVQDSSLASGFFISSENEFILLLSNKNFACRLYKVVIGELEIGGRDENMGYYISGADGGRNKISDLKFHSVLGTGNNIDVQNAEIDNLNVSGNFAGGKSSFSDCSFSNIYFYNLINSGTIRVARCTFDKSSYLRITDSDFGKMFLFGIDFGQIGTFSIYRSNLGEMVYSEVKWCKRISPNLTVPMSSAQMRETYKQLKNITAKHNDKPEELRFHSLEMRAYKQEMKAVKSRWNDKIILMFNELTNDHGQSWVRPFFAILLFILGSYFPIKYLLGFNSFAPEKFLTAISEMMECFNPVRKFSDSFGQTIPPADNWKTALAKILDILFLRVAVGLLIFQMVKAFRKYVK